MSQIILTFFNSNLLKIALFLVYLICIYFIEKDKFTDKRISSFLIFTIILFHFSYKFYPVLINDVINGDEGLYLAAGLGLTNISGILWGSIDFLTNGPLHIGSFIIPKLLGFEGDFANARIIWLLYTIAGMVFIFLTLKNIFNLKVAAYAMAYPLVYFSNSVEFDFNHFYNEISSNFFLILGAYFLSKEYHKDSPNLKYDYIAFVLIGLAPYAKLQSVIICFAIVFYHIFLRFQSNKINFKTYLPKAIFFGVLPTILLIIYLLYFGVLSDFYNFYLKTNLSYGSDESNFEKIRRTFITRDGSSFLINYHLKHLFVVITGLSAIMLFFVKKLKKEICYFLLVSAAAIYSISKPGNSWGHYFSYLFYPLSLGFGVLFASFFELFSNQSKLVLGAKTVFILILIIVFGYHLKLHNEITLAKFEKIGEISELVNQPKKVSKLAQLLIDDSKSETIKPRMAIYGCTADLHVQTGFMQATHQNIVERLYGFQATDSSTIKFSRAIYLADLKKNKPKYFLVPLDSVVCYHNFTITGMKRIPEIYNYFNTNYIKINQLEGFDVFRRKEENQ